MRKHSMKESILSVSLKTRTGSGVSSIVVGTKACKEELSIDKQTLGACHKCHINKTRGISFVAFAFTNNIENDGEAMKLASWGSSLTRLQKRRYKRRFNNRMEVSNLMAHIENKRKTSEPNFFSCVVIMVYVVN